MRLGLTDAPAGAVDAGGRQVGHDKYSLIVDGRRVMVWSGEFDYFRLPSPQLWRDVLEKIRAAGFTGVSLYFHWGYHSPAPGVYDFTGVRDVERLLRMTEELGLYVVANPGGRVGSSDPGYTAAYREWLSHINAILARHQVTRGGSVVAYNTGNEYAVNADPVYMEQLRDKARADGIDVPIDPGNARCAKHRVLTDPNSLKVHHKSDIIGSGATMYGYDMVHSGISWGWLPQSTSYDYGTAIDESRGRTAKYDEFKRQAYFMTTVSPLTKTDPAPAPGSTDPAVFTQARSNPDTGTQFVLVRHADPSTATDVSTTLAWSTPDGDYSVPVRVNGQDAKILVAGYDLGGQRLVWSSSEILTHTQIHDRDVTVLYGRDGEQGSTVLRYSSAPDVRVLEGVVRSSFDGKDLWLDYRHSGLARVLISGGGRPPMLLMLGTDQTAAQFWRLDTATGPVLVRGSYLARSAVVAGNWLVLKADMEQAGEIEIFAPVRQVVVDGKLVRTDHTPSGSVMGRLPGPRPVMLPALPGWQYRSEPPAFGESGWMVADKTTTVSPIKPKTLPVLYADEYGYHYGNVWYRGTFTASGSEKTVSVNAITGKRGNYLVWLNGHYLGSAAGGTHAGSEQPVDPGPGDFTIPDSLLIKGSTAKLSVLVTNMGHNGDWAADDTRFKQPRGLFGVTIGDAKISWRIRGAANHDAERGPLNNGGLYGERVGWHLPDTHRRWSPPPATAPAGVSWYRTTFRLALPKDQDVPIALRFDDHSGREYRAFVFVNGWNMGQYVHDGPQRDFVLPAGVLGKSNTLVLAVIATEPGVLGPVRLVALGNRWTGAAAVGQAG